MSADGSGACSMRAAADGRSGAEARHAPIDPRRNPQTIVASVRNSRTLVVHLGGIGDFLLACPALRRLAETTRITLVGRRDRLSLAVAGGIAEAAQDLDSVDFDSAFHMPSKRLREFLAPFDRAVIWMQHAEEVVGAFRQCGIGEVEAFPGLPPDDWPQHASIYYAVCLGFPDAPLVRLSIPPGGPPLDVVLHAGSGSPRKNWPLERFRAVADYLAKRGRRVEWCVGPAEEGLHLPSGARVLQVTSLTDLARRLAGARQYVGNDSGITHLAACVGCPTVALFGPTNPDIWAPRGDNVTVVHARPWPEVEDVTGILDAAPAGRGGRMRG